MISKEIKEKKKPTDVISEEERRAMKRKAQQEQALKKLQEEIQRKKEEKKRQEEEKKARTQNEVKTYNGRQQGLTTKAGMQQAMRSEKDYRKWVEHETGKDYNTLLKDDLNETLRQVKNKKLKIDQMQQIEEDKQAGGRLNELAAQRQKKDAALQQQNEALQKLWKDFNRSKQQRMVEEDKQAGGRLNAEAAAMQRQQDAQAKQNETLRNLWKQNNRAQQQRMVEADKAAGGRLNAMDAARQRQAAAQQQQNEALRKLYNDLNKASQQRQIEADKQAGGRLNALAAAQQQRIAAQNQQAEALRNLWKDYTRGQQQRQIEADKQAGGRLNDLAAAQAQRAKTRQIQNETLRNLWKQNNRAQQQRMVEADKAAGPQRVDWSRTAQAQQQATANYLSKIKNLRDAAGQIYQDKAVNKQIQLRPGGTGSTQEMQALLKSMGMQSEGDIWTNIMEGRDPFNRTSAEAFRAANNYERSLIDTGYYDGGDDIYRMTDEGLEGYIRRLQHKAEELEIAGADHPGALWSEVFDFVNDLDMKELESRAEGTGPSEFSWDAYETNNEAADALDRMRETEEARRQEILEEAAGFFKNANLVAELKGLEGNMARAALYDRIMGESYMERTAAMTAQEREKLDAMIDNIIEQAQSYMPNGDELDYVNSKLAEALEEQELRGSQSNLASWASESGMSGEYDPSLHPEAKWVFRGDGDADLVAQGTAIQQAYYWANNKQPMGYGQTHKEYWMDEDMLKTFNQLYAQDMAVGHRDANGNMVPGSNRAEMYLKALDPYLTKVQMAYTENFARETAEIPVVGGLARGITYLTAPVAGAAASLGALSAMFGGSGNDADSGWYLQENFNKFVREQQNKSIDDWAVEVFGEGARGAGQFVMGVIDSMADNLIAKGVGTGLASGAQSAEEAQKIAMFSIQLIMSGEATGNAMLEQLGKGRSGAEAAEYAILNGIVEAVTEKWSLERILNPELKNMSRSEIAKHILKSFAAEGSEEIASDIANTAVDEVLSMIYDHQDELTGRYYELMEQEKLSPEEASNRAIMEKVEQMLQSGLAGGLSGGLFALGSLGTNLVNLNREGKQINGYNVGDMSGQDAVLDMAQNMPKGSAAQQQAEQILAMKGAGKNVQNWRVGELARSTEEEAAKSGDLDTLYKMAHVRGNELTKPMKDKVGQHLANEDDIRLAEGERSGGRTDAVIQGGNGARIGKVLGMNDNGKFIVEIGGQQELKDASDLKATDFGTAAIIHSRATMKGIYSDQFTDQLIRAQAEGKIQNIGKTLPQAEKIRWAAYLGRSMPQTELDSQLAEDIYRESMKEAGEQRKSAVDQVKNFRGIKNGRTVFQGTEYGTNQFDEKLKSAGLSKNEQKQVRAVAEFAKLSGIELHLTTTQEIEEAGKVAKAWGYHGAETAAGIELNIDSLQSEGGEKHNIAVTFGHEMTHWLMRNATQSYYQLQDFVLSTLENEMGAGYLSKRAQGLMDSYATQGVELSMNDAIDEIVANSCDQVLGSEQVASYLQENQPTLFKQVQGFVKNLVDRIRKGFGNMRDSASVDAILMGQHANDLAKIWLGAYDEALTGEIRQAEEQGKARSSFAERPQTIDMDEALSNPAKYNDYFTHENLTKKEPIKLIDLSTGQNQSRDQIITAALNNAEKVGYRNNMGRFVHVYDTGTDVMISKKGLDHTPTRMTQDYQPVLEHVGELLQNAVVYNTADGRTSDQKGTYMLLSAGYTNDGKIIYVSFNVNRYTHNLQELDVYYSTKKANRKEADVTMTGALAGKGLSPTASSEVSIAEAFDDVKDAFANTLPKDVLDYLNTSRRNTKDTPRLHHSLAENITGKLTTEEQKNTEGGPASPNAIATGKMGNDQNRPSSKLSINEASEIVKKDKAYREAVERGDLETATNMLMEKLRETQGIIPFMAPHWDVGTDRVIGRALKDADPEAIEKAANDMMKYVPDNAVLIPMPDHTGKVHDDDIATILAKRIGELTGRPVIAALEGADRESRRKAKKEGRKGVNEQGIGFRQVAEIPEGTFPIFIDNMVGSGITANAARMALGGGMTLAYSNSSLSKGIKGLKNAIVTYDRNKNLIPLSQRFNTNVRDVRYSMAAAVTKQDEKYLELVRNGDMQAAQKMVDQTAKEAGYTKKVYHGTPTGGFTQFRDWSYFTENKKYADRYNHPSASSIRGYAVEEESPMTYELMMNPGRVFDTRKKAAANLYNKIRYEMGMGELGDKGLPDWVDGRDLIEYIEENDLPYDTIILDEGGDGGYGEPVVSRGVSYVTRSNMIKSADPVTYDNQGNVIPLSERFNRKENDIRFSMTGDKTEEQLRKEYQEAGETVTELREKKRAMKPEMDAWVERLSAAQENGNWEEEIEKYKEWEKGYTQVAEDLYNAEQRQKEANKAFDAYIEERDTAEERKKIEKSGLTEPEYRRKQAADVFGYTSDFREAGYMLPNGRMLNFSGEKGRHYGSRAEDHRAIGQIYASSELQGGAAMMQFMKDGNIRVMAETPGVDIATTAEPTREQYEAIRNMARRFAGEEYFNVDLTDEKGYTVDTLEYEGRVDPTRIINDIKSYFKTGEIRQQSVVSQFHYSMAENNMDVGHWLEGLAPSSLRTEGERQLQQAYKSLRMSIKLSEKRQAEYSAEIQKLQGRDNLLPDERDQLIALQNKLQIQQDKHARLEDELAEVTSSEGYAGMMYYHTKMLQDFVAGRTQEQVQASVDQMVQAARTAKADLEEQEKNLQKMAESAEIRTAKSLMRKQGLQGYAKDIKSQMNTTMSQTEIENRLAEIALRQLKGEAVKEEIAALAEDIMTTQAGYGNEEAAEVLGRMRGMNIVIGPGQQAELKATHSSLKDIRARTKGSGIKFEYGDSSTLDRDLDEIYQAVPELRGQLENEKDALGVFVDYVQNKLQARRGSTAEEGTLERDMVELTLQSISNMILNGEKNNPELAREMLQTIVNKRGEAEQALATIRSLKQRMDDTVTAGIKANMWTQALGRDMDNTIDYFNKTARWAAEVERQRVRKNVIEMLKSDNARKLIEQEEKFKELIKKDKRARELHEDNESLRKQIHTVIGRVKNLLTAETDQKNIQEEAKPLARFMAGLLVNHDSAGFRHVMYASKKELADFAVRLDRLNAQEKKFDPERDLAWAVIKAPNEEENDYTVRDKLVQDLIDIETGLMEYRNAEGKGNISLQDRNKALEKVQEAVSEIYSVIKARSEAHIARQKYNVFELAESFYEDAQKSTFKGERRGFGSKAADSFWKSVGYGNLTPEYFIKNLKNRTMTLLQKGMHDAEQRSGLEARKAQERIAKIAEETGFSTWDGQEKHKIRLVNGSTVEMTTEQIMALYATWQRESNQLRPEETSHLLKGGFVLAQNDQDKGKYRREKDSLTPIRVHKGDLEKLSDYLTPEQIQFVDAIVDYMSNDLAALGNEASLKTYGIRKFTEKYYFPIKAWGGVLNKSSASGTSSMNDNRAMRQSFTKRIQNKARNAIEISDFTPTAMKHIVGMINFNTVGPAVENMNKVLNQQLQFGEVNRNGAELPEDGEYEDETYKRNMRAVFQQQYGKNAYKYLEQFMDDVNGGVSRRDETSLKGKLLSIFKKNAVAGSLSVAAQQPLSYIRAAMLVNPKYMAQAISPQYWKGSYNEMMEHSGLAVIKKMGRFDMNYGQSMQDYITPEGMQSKAKQLAEKTGEAVTSLPEKMDAMTWTRMWTACKLEQHALNPDMDMKSDEFLDKVTERFNEVMRRTQVYDSVMVKSQNMRSKSDWKKAITSFMAEPTLSLNVLADAWLNIKEKGGKANAKKALAAFLLSAAAQAGVKGFFGAARSPKKEKNKEENFMNRFAMALMSEMNPLGLIPGYSQLAEVLINGELNDDAMGMISKAKDAWDKIYDLAAGTGNKTAYRTLEDSLAQLVQIGTDIPLKNFMRDFRAMVNWFSGGTAQGLTGDTYAQRETSGAVLKYQTRESLFTQEIGGLINAMMGEAGYKTTNDAYYKRLYRAVKDGRTKEADQLREFMTLTKIKAEDPEKTIRNQLNKMAREDDNLPTEEKAKIMKEIDPEADDDSIFFQLDREAYEKETGTELSGSAKYYRLDDAMNGNKSAEIREAVQTLLEHGVKAKSIIDRMKDQKQAYLEADSKGKVRIRNAIQIVYKELGYTAEDADKVIDKWKN